MSFKNSNWLRNLNLPDELGMRLFEALDDLDQQHQRLVQQMNGSSTGRPLAPPGIGGISVTGQNGHFNIRIIDRGPVYAGIRYFAVHADNPAFTNPQVEALGESRNKSVFLGNVGRYWAGYSAYLSSPPSPVVYHGFPTLVMGGGSIGGPAFQDSEGSGTSLPGIGFEGPGIAPFRSSTGIPPKR